VYTYMYCAQQQLPSAAEQMTEVTAQAMTLHTACWKAVITQAFLGIDNSLNLNRPLCVSDLPIYVPRLRSLYAFACRVICCFRLSLAVLSVQVMASDQQVQQQQQLDSLLQRFATELEVRQLTNGVYC